MSVCVCVCVYDSRARAILSRLRHSPSYSERGKCIRAGPLSSYSPAGCVHVCVICIIVRGDEGDRIIGSGNFGLSGHAALPVYVCVRWYGREG